MTTTDIIIAPHIEPMTTPVDRPALASRVAAAFALADEVMNHGKRFNQLENLSLGVAYGLNCAATVAKDLLASGGPSFAFVDVLRRLDEAEHSAADLLARTDVADLETLALAPTRSDEVSTESSDVK